MPTVTLAGAALASPETALPLLPVSVSSFKRLRTGQMLYVDKTELICRLAQISGKFFFIRPRRFGKSLLVSTLACLFENGTQYFSGLAAERLWRDKTYTVVRIDFSEAKNFRSFEQFAKQMRDTLTTAFEPADLFPDSES